MKITVEIHIWKGGESLKQTKDERIISALLCTSTVRAASSVCGISESQIYARLRDPVFKAKYDDARRQLLERAVGGLQGHLSAAVDKLREVMDSVEASPQTQLNAAESILRSSLKMSERIDILERVDAVEKALRELENQR